MSDIAAAAPDPASALLGALPAFLDALAVGVTVWDDGLRCVYANSAGAAQLEHSPEALVGATLTDVLGPERYREHVAEFDAVRRGQAQKWESQAERGGRMLTRRVQLLPRRHPDGRIDGFIDVTIEDVTVPLQAAAALEKSNAALRQLYERTPAMLHSIDVSGRLLTVSDAWLDRLGYRREEVLGRRSLEFLAPASAQQVVAEHLPRLWRHGYNERLSLQMVRKDGTRLDVLLSAVVLRDAEGRPERGVAVIEDVTEVVAHAAELRREQAARRQIEQQADELARLARERSEMLDLLAHEVRQPLNNASAAVQSVGAWLAAKGEQGASARLERAQGVLTDVHRHVDNTLALSTVLVRGSAEAPEEEADIDAVLDVAVAELPAAERGRVSISRLTPARSARMDSSRVRLALRNLLANGLHHTAPGTPVQLRVSDSESPLALFIDVVDHGDGLPAELLPRLFERGNRVRHADGRVSHGLGLFIAHRAMATQGGELRLLATGARGTTWRLVLPQGGGG